uniref:Essential meiotic structure-specific endonuclease 1 n=1 Tax=Cyclopterus lumpus TaxID=8103 RepID=A0A8C3AYS9_CYCLU
MGSYSDSTSDLDEELPVFDFLQAGRCRASPSHDSDASEATASAAKGNAAARTGTADVLMISSDSDDGVPYVPLAQRLAQRRGKAISASSSTGNGEDAERCSPLDLAGARLPRPNWPPGSERPLGLHQVSSGGPEASPVRRKPTRRTEEEIQASREEALWRRQAGRGQQKGKEALRQEQERQKAERKALAEAARALRPEECIKRMVVPMCSEGGGTLLASVQALGCSCAVEKQPVPRSVSWRRRTPGPDDSGGACVPEAHVVIQLTVDDFITLIHGYEERRVLGGSGPTLTSWVQEQQRRHPGKVLSLAVIDLEKYFRSQKSQSQKRFRDAVAGEERGGGKAKKRRKNGGDEARPEVSRVEVEEAVVHLQLHTGVSVRFLLAWKDFSAHIAMTTRAVAEAPYKREREQTGFSFYLESEWAGGQRVDRGGRGLLQAWRRQIQQFNRVSPDMASAILAAYPSPQLLRKAYSLCKTEREKISLLSDLVVRRGEGVTSTTRRVGPELSKRLFLMMNSCDPQQTLDSTV